MFCLLLKRLLPLDMVADLLLPPYPDLPFTEMARVRPYCPKDKLKLIEVWKQTGYPEDLPVNCGVEISSEELLEALLDLCGDMCFVLVDSRDETAGFTVAHRNAADLFSKLEKCWLPSKRGLPLAETAAQDSCDEVEMKPQPYYKNEQIESRYSALLQMHLTPTTDIDIFASRRLMACAAMALRCTGCTGVHTFTHVANRQVLDEYTMLKFYNTQLPSLPDGGIVLGRTV